MGPRCRFMPAIETLQSLTCDKPSRLGCVPRKATGHQRTHGLSKIFWRVPDEVQWCVPDGVPQCKAIGVQSLSGKTERRGTPVQGVRHQGVPDVGKVHPDLMSPSGMQAATHSGQPSRTGQRLHIGSGRTAMTVNGHPNA